MLESKTCTLLQSQEVINSVFIYRTFLPTLGETPPLDEREEEARKGRAMLRNLKVVLGIG
jgi:hypothetical protein